MQWMQIALVGTILTIVSHDSACTMCLVDAATTRPASIGS
jgi:hypothetical protein